MTIFYKFIIVEQNLIQNYCYSIQYRITTKINYKLLKLIIIVEY